jgi:hypothetical protein
MSTIDDNVMWQRKIITKDANSYDNLVDIPDSKARWQPEERQDDSTVEHLLVNDNLETNADANIR